MSSRGRGRGRGRGSSAELLRDVNEDIGAQTEIARDKSPPRYPAAFEVPEVQLITLSDQNARESFHRHLRNRDSQPAVFDVSNCPYDSKLLMGLLTSNLLLPPRPLKRKVVRAPILPKRLRADSNISLTAAETGKDGSKVVEDLIEYEDKQPTTETQNRDDDDDVDEDQDMEIEEDLIEDAPDDDYGKNYYDSNDEEDEDGGDNEE